MYGASPTPTPDPADGDVRAEGGLRGRVILLGNPNVGKSVLFNALTGLRATVSNYPGTTVEVARGRLAGTDTEVIDSPGLNSILPLSEDERVTWDLVRATRGDPGAVVVQVADAKNLRRALLLTLQLGQLEVPSVLVLNMSDEAEARGIRIDQEGLEEALGIPVCTTVATKGLGVAEVQAALAAARLPRNHLPLSEDIAGPALELLTDGESAGSAEPGFQARYHEALLAHAETLARRFATEAEPATKAMSRRLGRLAVHPIWGWPILAAVLIGLYEFVGVFGAGTLVDLFETKVFGGYLSPWATALFGLVPWAPVRDLFVGEYGLITMGLSYGLAIVLPIVATFFTVFAILEDSGYLPRLAVMSDRVFRVMGLNGKAVLPMVLGLGCDTMATLTTRILPTPKERLLATLLLALGIPCSAQLGVILAMLAVVPIQAAAIWFAAVAGVMVTVGWLAARVLPGERGDFVVELPPMRLPELGNVLSKTVARVEWYLKEALPLFLLGTFVLFALDRLRLLDTVVRAGKPLVTGILGLPAEASSAFLIGFLRRDFAATRLFDMSRAGALDVVQLVVAMVTITLFIPCIANVFIIAKERGWRTAAAMAAFIFPIAFAVGGLVRVVMLGLGFGGAS
ncbi:MAG: ferrous iron transport protein B [Acidobacteria bacterium]|nr:ferrous iron transport protein B [Acidobacteriota bacterium]